MLRSKQSAPMCLYSVLECDYYDDYDDDDVYGDDFSILLNITNWSVWSLL
jgi:hypothetical protein